ncbi:hypothetical protein GCM10028812_06910 [Ancylobacter sonchi]
MLPSSPADHFTLLIGREGFGPHLREEELVVVDPSDNEPESGEFYAIAYGSAFGANGVIYRLCQIKQRWGFLRSDGILYSSRPRKGTYALPPRRFRSPNNQPRRAGAPRPSAGPWVTQLSDSPPHQWCQPSSCQILPP